MMPGGETDAEPEHDSGRLRWNWPKHSLVTWTELRRYQMVSPDALLLLLMGTLPDLSAEGEHNMQDADGR